MVSNCKFTTLFPNPQEYAKNYDPENIYAGDSDFSSTRGGDGSGDGDGYPVMRSYSIGLSITF